LALSVTDSVAASIFFSALSVASSSFCPALSKVPLEASVDSVMDWFGGFGLLIQ